MPHLELLRVAPDQDYGGVPIGHHLPLPRLHPGDTVPPAPRGPGLLPQGQGGGGAGQQEAVTVAPAPLLPPCSFLELRLLPVSGG